MSQDKAEFAEFFAASWEPCLRAVAASTGNMTLAEDQTAEAFGRAWASWHKVRRHPAPRAWVVRTALNAGASWWRRRNKETALTSDDIAAAASQGTGLDSAVLTAPRRLPARQREVIVLRVFTRELRDSLSQVVTAKRPPLAAITDRGRAHQWRRRTAFAGLRGAGVAAATALSLGLTGVLGTGVLGTGVLGTGAVGAAPARGTSPGTGSGATGTAATARGTGAGNTGTIGPRPSPSHQDGDQPRGDTPRDRAVLRLLQHRPQPVL